MEKGKKKMLPFVPVLIKRNHMHGKWLKDPPVFTLFALIILFLLLVRQTACSSSASTLL